MRKMGAEWDTVISDLPAQPGPLYSSNTKPEYHHIPQKVDSPSMSTEAKTVPAIHHPEDELETSMMPCMSADEAIDLFIQGYISAKPYLRTLNKLQHGDANP